jgi:antitoxin PrlF
MRVTSKGQVTIPKAIRDAYGFLPDTDVEFVVVDGVVTLVKAESTRPDRADRAVAALHGSARPGVTTDDLLALTRAWARPRFLVDSNVLLDHAVSDPTWLPWSRAALTEALPSGPVLINPMIYAEVATGYDRV